MIEAQKIQENLYYDERSAGGLVYKKEGDTIFWLLIKTAPKKRMGDERVNLTQKYVFKFPKGHLEGSEFLKQAALREVEEEGRVKAEIVSKIGSNNYVIWDKLKHRKIIKKVTFFLMKFESNSSLKHFDTEGVLDREWMTYEKASEILAYDSEKILLKKARQKLESILKHKK